MTFCRRQLAPDPEAALNSVICFRGSAILPDRILPDCAAVCEGGRIISIGRRTPPQIRLIVGYYIAPGYIDLHVHGGDGADYMEGGASAVHGESSAPTPWNYHDFSNHYDRHNGVTDLRLQLRQLTSTLARQAALRI